MATELHELDRREIFLKLVQLQDEGVRLDDSRNSIAEQFDIDAEYVRDIESEGLKKKWPPL